MAPRIVQGEIRGKRREGKRCESDYNGSGKIGARKENGGSLARADRETRGLILDSLFLREQHS